MAAFRIFRRLAELLDVNFTSLVEDDVPAWDATAGQWVNRQRGSGGGGVSRLINLVDVAGTDGAGKAPVSDGADTFTLTDVATQAELDAHAADTTSVHGIADTSTLYAAGGTDVAVADGGTGASTASGARTNLGLVIGTDVEAHDADLSSIAALDSSTSGAIASDGAGWVKKTYAQFKTALSLVAADVGLGNVTNDAQLKVASNLSDLNNAGTARSNLGLVIGTDVEAHDSDLTTIAGLSPTNDDVLQRKAGAWANRSIAQLLTDLAAAGTTFQPLDSDLTALAGLSVAADTLPYGSGSHAMSLATLTSFARTLLDDADAATARATLGVTSASTDGWTDDTANTWTYVSATSFKLSGVDRTAVFTPGTRLRCKQGGAYKYFVIVSSSFSTDTTVTITGGDDYSLANAAITDNYYSYEANPQGYPTCFAFTPSVTGFSGSPSISAGRFAVAGTVCTYWVPNISGTSNASTFTVTLPISAAAKAQAPIIVKDVNTLQTSPGLMDIDTASPTIVSLFKNYAAGAFTGSGTKACASGFPAPIIYEIV